MAGLKYNQITRYKVTAICEGPLHIGSAIGGKEEVLIDPLNNRPFVQASSIAGVFRGYCKEVLKDERYKILFGTNNVENMSRLSFEDGCFKDNCKMEYRPHVSINKATGSVSSKTIKGTTSSSGQKFNMEYVGAGSEIIFNMYLYEDTTTSDNLYDLTNSLLSSMKEGMLQFGGKKSNGAGILRLIDLRKRTYKLDTPSDRQAWIMLNDNDLESGFEILTTVKNDKLSYEVVITGRTENYIQVKGLDISGNGKDAPDSQNIKNAKMEYIIPGSSFKGAIKAQMEKISEYLGCKDLIVSSFGKAAEHNNSGKIGNMIFADTIIGDSEANDRMPLEHRIHIDKFTGSVFDKGLFHEKNAAGDVELKINILDKNEPQKTLGLLLFALRDLAIGAMNLGSGYNVGKGIINVSKISIYDIKNEMEASINYLDGNGTVVDKTGIVNEAINSLKGGRV